MSEIAIKVEGLGKKYQIGQSRSGDLRETFGNLFHPNAPHQRINESTNQHPKEFWALKDISFEIPQGQAVGIIGRNGAGKSTLLKILSRITEPTSGRVEIIGRVSSLLEVGTGFHPELTGKENIYLNGTILGMKRREVKSKFDEIVEFSGVEKFIDTPIKHYSSGMKVRLAFSVAAYLEPEILLIDEVLAVGDAEFQKKCLGKMGEVAGQGRTVLFVSHNLEAVKNICTRCMVLEEGALVTFNEVLSAINTYHKQIERFTINGADLLSIPRSNYKGELIFKHVIFDNSSIEFSDPIRLKIEILNKQFPTIFNDVEVAFSIRNFIGSTMIHGSTRYIQSNFLIDSETKFINVEVPNNLRPGRYYITLFLREKGNIQDWLTDISSFEIREGSPYKWNNLSEIQGLTFPDYKINV